MLAKLSRQLVPGGYLFLGHSESLHRWTFRWRRWRPRCTGKTMAEHNIELPEVYLQPGEVYWRAAQPCSRPCWDRVLGSRSGVRGWAWGRCAMACCRDVPPAVRDLDGISLRGLRDLPPDPAVRRLWRRGGRNSGQGIWRSGCAARIAARVPQGDGRPAELSERAGGAAQESYAVLSSDTGGVAGRTIQFRHRYGHRAGTASVPFKPRTSSARGAQSEAEP